MPDVWVTNASRGTHELVAEDGTLVGMVHLAMDVKGGAAFHVYLRRGGMLRHIATLPWTQGLEAAKQEVASRRSSEEMAEQGTTSEPQHGHPVQHGGAQRSA